MFRRISPRLFNRQIAGAALRVARPRFVVPKMRLQQSITPLRFYSSPAEIGKIDKPTYQLTFTCKACDTRSSHLVSKQAYHNGTVLIQCPSCKNRHLIADHLNVFGEGKQNLEDILKQKGEKITKSSIDLSKIGDLEWEGPGSEPEQVHLPETK